MWDTLTNIFAEMDSQLAAHPTGDEQGALGDTLESLRSLMEMHVTLQSKAARLQDTRAAMAGQRDAALASLAALERSEETRPGSATRRRPVQRAWGAYAYSTLDDENSTAHVEERVKRGPWRTSVR